MKRNSYDEEYVFKVWMLMMQARNIVYKAREQELRRFSITPEQAGILFAINDLKDQSSIPAIKRLLVRESNSVSNLLNRLTRKGLVQKKLQPGKKPAIFELTKSGEELYRMTVKRESIFQIMSSLSKKELEDLELYLRKILDVAFQNMADSIKPTWP